MPKETDITNISVLVNEYTNFKNSLNNGASALNAVIAMGTVLYNDPTLIAQFPQSAPVYQTYLVALQASINNFIASVPVEPPLSS